MEIKIRLVNILERLLILLLIILLSPVYIVLSLSVLVFSGWPIFFVQKRTGYKGQIFKMYKFRTMRVGADKEQNKLRKMNEADGPVFKIKNDPRFTKVGIFLSHSGLDELPQLFNVAKGEMSLIGPRPLPVSEAEAISKKYKMIRESVRPGLISPWVVGGYHSLTFEQWMESDMKYVENKSFKNDFLLLTRGIFALMKLILREINLIH